MRTTTLRTSAIVFALAIAFHTVDHIRRGVTSVTDEVSALGNLAMVIEVTAIVLVLVGHRLAPLVAVAAGFPLAAGYVVVHVLPEWSDFSDSFTSGDVGAVSWVAALVEIAGALFFGGAGLQELRRRGGVSSMSLA